MSVVTASEALTKSGVVRRAAKAVGAKNFAVEKKDTDGDLFQVDETAPSDDRRTPKIRCKDRYHDFRREVFALAAGAALADPDRHDEIFDQAEKAARAGPDWSRYRRQSKRMKPPKVSLDRNEATRIMHLARLLEVRSYSSKKRRKSMKAKPLGKRSRPGVHGGWLGRAAIAVLETLLFVVKRTKGVFPSLDRIAALSRYSRPTVVKALAILEQFGFVTIHRRVRETVVAGRRLFVQDSNAYELHMPRGGSGAFAFAVFGLRPELKNLPARETGDNSSPSLASLTSPGQGSGSVERLTERNDRHRAGVTKANPHIGGGYAGAI